MSVPGAVAALTLDVFDPQAANCGASGYDNRRRAGRGGEGEADAPSRPGARGDSGSAWAERAERGWSGFTVDGVAARSGAAKSVIYRRWSGRVEPAHALLDRERMSAAESVESRGDLRTDLLTFLRGMTEFLRGPFGDASRGIAIEGAPGDHVGLFGGEVLVARIGQIVEEARARGEIGDPPPPLALNVGVAVVMWEFIHTHSPPTDTGLEELVDRVWLPALRGTAA